MYRLADQKLVVETPGIYASSEVQGLIVEEKNRPSKQWVFNVMQGKQEAHAIRVQTDHFILLPDTERINRYWSILSNTARMMHSKYPWNKPACTVNWLAICTEPGLHSMRDLRVGHLPMLRELQDKCQEAIAKETSVSKEEIMAYVHYPPSVFQLHIHFAYPYAQPNHRDVFRIHPLATIIANLEVDPEYYAKASIQVSVQKDSPWHKMAMLAKLKARCQSPQS